MKELSDALGVLEGVGEYQLRQVSPKVFVLLLLADGGKDGLAEEAESILLKLYGKEASVEVTCVDSFPPEPSGKHRLSRTDFAIGIDEYVDPSCITLTSGGVV